MSDTLAARTTATAQPLTLYDLTDRLLFVEQWIAEHQEEIIAAKGDLDAVPGLVEALDAVEGAFHEKVERVVLFIEQRQAIMTARLGQRDRFAKLADADKRTIESLKTYLVRCQRRAGRTKVETGQMRSNVQRNSQPSVERRDGALPLWVLKAVAMHALGLENAVHGEHDSDSPEIMLQRVPSEVVSTLRLRAVDIALRVRGIHDAVLGYDELLAAIEEVPASRPSYAVNRDAVLSTWRTAYDAARERITADAAADYEEQNARPIGGNVTKHLNEYDLDRLAHDAANAHPLLVTLGVTVEQGYHVRLK